MAPPSVDCRAPVPGGHGQQKNYAKRQIDAAIGEVYRRLARNRRACGAFQQIAHRVQELTDLLRPTPELYRWSDACLYVHGLENLALNRRAFRKPIRAWQPVRGSHREVFASLVRHLLMKDPAPAFMMGAWLQPASAKARRQQAWHIGMSRGASIRDMDVPMRMTRRMETLFRQVPHHFTIEQALRHAQVLALGGDKMLANAVIATRMGREHENGAFWEDVVHFFINAKALRTEDVNPIVDFLHYVKFAKREVVTGRRIALIDPPLPEFSMKGRSLRSVLRRVKQWHGELAAAEDCMGQAWSATRAIHGYTRLEESMTRRGETIQHIWSINELLSHAALTTEGRAMHHCVRVYGSACARGKSTIWSMTLETAQNTRRQLTIEVDPRARVIRQARGKCNRLPGRRSKAVLLEWARREGLTLGPHI